MTHHGEALRKLTKDDGLIDRLREDVDGAELEDRWRALADYALLLTRTPSRVDDAAIGKLRDAGLDDRSIHDATAVVAYYNLANRMVEALGVDLEE